MKITYRCSNNSFDGTTSYFLTKLKACILSMILKLSAICRSNDKSHFSEHSKKQLGPSLLIVYEIKYFKKKKNIFFHSPY